MTFDPNTFTASISSLPYEIVAKIVLFATYESVLMDSTVSETTRPRNFLYTALFVCKYWSDVALKSPEVWSIVPLLTRTLEHDQQPNWQRKLEEHSKHCPSHLLHIHITVTSVASCDLERFFQPFSSSSLYRPSSRIRTISISIDELNRSITAVLNTIACSELYTNVCQTLEELELDWHGVHRFSSFMDLNFGLQKLLVLGPSLQRLAISRLALLPSSTSPARGLHDDISAGMFLARTSLDSLQEIRLADVSPSVLRTLFRQSLPTLTTLYVQCSYQKDDPAFDVSLPSPASELHSYLIREDQPYTSDKTPSIQFPVPPSQPNFPTLTHFVLFNLNHLSDFHTMMIHSPAIEHLALSFSWADRLGYCLGTSLGDFANEWKKTQPTPATITVVSSTGWSSQTARELSDTAAELPWIRRIILERRPPDEEPFVQQEMDTFETAIKELEGKGISIECFLREDLEFKSVCRRMALEQS